MASATPEDKLSYVMTVLLNTEMPKPDYRAVAVQTGITDANTAQKKFRAIVKASGFDLVKDRIVLADGSAHTPSDSATTPAKKPRGKKTEGGTPKTPTKKTTGETKTTAKKRKLDEAAEDDNNDEPEKDVKPKIEVEV